MKQRAWVPVVIAVVWGALAGAIVATVFTAMTAAQRWIWRDDLSRWFIPVVVIAGGVLIALLRPLTDDHDLDAQIRAAANPFTVRRKRTAVLALSAIVAYGFGGAIGPEAGLIAVIAELSALVSARIARSEFEARVFGQSGSAAALAGIYASPPGAAAYDDDSLAPSKVYSFIAAGVGFLAFLAVQRAIGPDHSDLGIPGYRHDTLQLVAALVPAVLGALVGLAYVRLRGLVARVLTSPRLGSPRIQTLVGTALFAALATAFPVALFSGHDQLAGVATFAGQSSWALLAGAALVKILGMAVLVNSGWRGGEFFPLLFAGAAAGATALLFVPGLGLATAEVAGLAAATAVGLRKPVAAVLICALLIGQPAWGPLIVGATVSMLLLRWVAPKDAAAT